MLVKPQIIHEDDSIVIINKPSGWVIDKVQEWLAKNFQFSIFSFRECRHGLTHRLDKETSGCLIIAKDIESFKNIQKQFAERSVKKTYLALLHDKLIPEIGKVEVTVGRLPWKRTRFGVLEGGRESISEYKVIKYLEDEKDNEYSLVEFYPQTGRTHQIRIHAKHLHHPIVSDEFYAGRKRARSDRKWCPRLFLHAQKIQFTHPVSGERVKIEAQLPEDLKEVLKGLR